MTKQTATEWLKANATWAVTDWSEEWLLTGSQLAKCPPAIRNAVERKLTLAPAHYGSDEDLYYANLPAKK